MFVDANSAVEAIPDGATLGVTGFRWAGMSEALLRALGDRYRKTGQPRGLTLVFSSSPGGGPGTGVEHLAQPGLLRRVVGGFWGVTPQLFELVRDGQVEGYNFPQGQIARLYQAIAAGQPGLITEIGLGTYIDPRRGGGRMNDRTPADLVEVVNLRGREWLLFHSFPITVGIIRATSADEAGNLSMEGEAVTPEALALAFAVHNSGGTVIAQALRRVPRGSLHPRSVGVPGSVVNRVVLAIDAETEHRQCMGTAFDPRFNGDAPQQANPAGGEALDPIRRQIASRALREIRPGYIVNLGQGIPSDIGTLARGSDLARNVSFTIESGVIGGVPRPVPDFGIAEHPDAIIRQDDQFAFYNGGGLDAAFLGFAEIDATGNVNASHFRGRTVGCGGFLDIAVPARRLVFCGAFSAGETDVDISGGRVTVRKDGPVRKLVRQVQQITFQAERGRRGEQPTLVVTERCVFELTPRGLRLTEVAPGVDVERDILASMEFTPEVADQLLVMPVVA